MSHVHAHVFHRLAFRPTASRRSSAPAAATTSLALLLAMLTLWLTPALVSPAAADAPEDAYTAHTAKDPAIELEHLRLLLRPLTQDELAVEAQAWMTQLRDKVDQISKAEIRQRFARQVIEATSAAPANTDAQGQAQTPDADAPDGNDQTPAPDNADAAPADANAADADAPVVPDPAAPIAEVVDVDAIRADPEAVRQQMLELLPKLRDEQTALIDRCDLVLTALERKGGDVEKHRQYIAALGDITIDVTDSQAVWTAVTGWLTSPQGGLRIAGNIGLFLLTLIAFAIVAWIAAAATRKAVSRAPRFSELLRDFLVKTVSRGVFLIGFIVALSMLEINIGPLLAAIGAIGFVVAFALQGTLSNFASGILILVYRPFDIGDVVDVAGVSGVVEAMTLVSTKIKSFDNKAIIVPNNSVWGGDITNYTGKDTRRVDLVFGISYSDDMAKAEKILRECVEAHELTLQEPAPTIKMHELADSSVNFICRPWVKTADYWTVYWDLMRTVKERFDAEGVSIPFPQRDVHLFQESKA